MKKNYPSTNCNKTIYILYDDCPLWLGPKSILAVYSSREKAFAKVERLVERDYNRNVYVKVIAMRVR